MCTGETHTNVAAAFLAGTSPGTDDTHTHTQVISHYGRPVFNLLTFLTKLTNEIYVANVG